MMILKDYINFLDSSKITNYFFAFLIVIAGYLIAKKVSNILSMHVSKRYSAHNGMLARRLIFYGLFLLFLTSGLNQIGFRLTVILGAAGIFTAAIAFAAQTAISNLISGFFLLFDKPFKIGDQVIIGDTRGKVTAIDLISTKLTSLQNTLIRIPNEAVLKATITNLTSFAKRIFEIEIGVSYDSNLPLVKKTLGDIIATNEFILPKPEPIIMLTSFADSAIIFKIRVSSNQNNLLLAKNSLYEAIHSTFKAEGIDIPFPHLTILQKDESAT